MIYEMESCKVSLVLRLSERFGKLVGKFGTPWILKMDDVIAPTSMLKPML